MEKITKKEVVKDIAIVLFFISVIVISFMLAPSNYERIGMSIVLFVFLAIFIAGALNQE
jgi:uncharacterized membrane protein YccC